MIQNTTKGCRVLGFLDFGQQITQISKTGINTLKIGSKSPQMVSWLQDQLAIIDQNAERLVTGGLYSAAIAAKILDFQTVRGLKSDGVVGRETIMKLNQLTDASIPRLNKGDE